MPAFEFFAVVRAGLSAKPQILPDSSGQERTSSEGEENDGTSQVDLSGTAKGGSSRLKEQAHASAISTGIAKARNVVVEADQMNRRI